MRTGTLEGLIKWLLMSDAEKRKVEREYEAERMRRKCGRE